MNFEQFFSRYEQLAQGADAAFAKIKTQHEECVRCVTECCDCCYALFDLTLIEALYINNRFKRDVSPGVAKVVLERAGTVDRQIAKIKRQAFKEHETGKSEQDIFEKIAAERVRCPALNEDNRCAIYEFRPITCRLYGVPTEIGGVGHTCGVSAFEPGKQYPTVRIDIIHQRLYDISFALANSIKSRYAQLADLLVPLSMALMTDYTPEYLGVSKQADPVNPNEA